MRDVAEVDRLLAAVGRQDSGAFRRLYAQTSGRLMAVVLRICRDRSAAEDVLQNVYVQVWRRAADYDPAVGSAMAWLTVMARNRAIDHVRSQRREAPATTEADESALENLPAFTPGAEHSSELRALLTCLGKLPPQHARAVLLAYYEGLTREELAQQFGIPENTIKTWLRRGLIALRECMGG